MKADLSRRTFNRTNHYSAVVMQQGRVAVDADWNEQHEIERHRIETETVDVVGLCGTPLDPPDFVDASVIRFIPTSITTAPGLIMSPVTRFARPAATIRISARRVFARRFFV